MASYVARLAALLGHARARTLLIIGGLFIGILLAASVGWLLVNLRLDVINDAAREMRNDALMLAEQEDRMLQAADVVQLGLIEHMRERGIDSPETFDRLEGSLEEHRSLLERIIGLSQISALSLHDVHGNLRNFSLSWPPPRIQSADQDYIRALTGPNAPQTYLSAPTRSAATGNWTIFLSRRFEAADGQLIGFVLAAVEMSYFEQLYARLPLTGGGSYSLYRRDGMLLARYPHVDPKIGQMFDASSSFRLVASASDGSLLRITSTLDGQDRLVVPHAMPHFPLIVAVSDTLGSVLRPWQQEARLLVVIVVLLEFVIAATVLLAVRHLRGYEKLDTAEKAQQRAEAELVLARERESASQALQAQEHRFNTALHSMLQGLLMVSQSGTVLVVNRRFHDLFGLPADTIVPGLSYQELTDRVVEHGNVSADDMAGVRERRTALVAAGTAATVTLDLSDGRIFDVTHKPMDDGWLTTFEDITERRATEARMAYLARHDALTDLPNRVQFREKLSEALTFARRGDIVALHCLDLDQFKAVNDTLGHPIGDALLQAVADRLRRHIRDTDTIARLGGDEFAVVQVPIERPIEATNLADRLTALVKTPFEVAGHQIITGVSIGIAFAPQDSMDVDELLRGADLALYRAKVDGRGIYRLFHAEMDAQMQVRRLLELDLRQALHDGQFELLYQPFVNLRDGAVSGVEALLRWNHPQRGLVSPAQFIPLAEEIGMIVPIGEWVLREACVTVASWPGDMRVAVNLSPAQFRSRDLLPMVHQALQDAGLRADRLELEITETVMLEDTEATLATLSALRNLGVGIAMDDFGTGYSSLGYLRRFPFDRIKIDQSFVRDLCTKPDCHAIVRAIAGLSHELGMATTAEGVETQAQLEALSRAGCTEVQGYLFSPAVPGSKVGALAESISEMMHPTSERMVPATAE